MSDLRDLLKRIRQWDALDTPDSDGAYWKREIDAALEQPEQEPAFDALVAISLLTHLGGEVADYEDVVEAVRRLHALNGELLEALKALCESHSRFSGGVWDKARAAIAKVEGKA